MKGRLPGVDAEMLTAAYWIQRMHETEEQRGGTACPRRSRGCTETAAREAARRALSPSLTDLNALGKAWLEHGSSQAAFERLQPPEPLPTLYDADGQVLDRTFWEGLFENARYDHRDLVLCPGFSVRRADLRTWPTSLRVFQRPDDEWDRFQETALHTFEPLLVVAPSRDGKWFEVTTQTYRGWVHAEDIALCSWEELRHYTQSEHIGVVTASSVSTVIPSPAGSLPGPTVEFAACLPLAKSGLSEAEPVHSGSHVSVYLPCRRPDGRLSVRKARIAAPGAIHPGFLPFTRENVLRSAFALLGEPYGWGDVDGRHDCSSFVMDVYRTVGVQLPRNAGDQEHALARRLIFPEHAAAQDRMRLLDGVLPGDPLYMPGHTMLFLGRVGERAYVIHDFVGYVEEDSGRARKVPVYQVTVSTLDIHTGDGRTYLESLTSALNLFAV